MVRLSDRLARLTVTVASPDGNIKVTHRRGDRITVGFRSEQIYRSYDAEELSRQLGAMFCTMKAGRRQGVRKVWTGAGYGYPDRKAPHWDARVRRFRSDLAQTTIRGRSRQGLIQIKATAELDDFRVKVAPEALRELDRDQFLVELYSAFVDLLDERRDMRNALRREHLPD